MWRSTLKARKNSVAVGETVVVFAIGPSGPSMEGTGTIESLCRDENLYWIKFSGDPVCRLRFVNPDWQACPERSLTLLREFWRSRQRDDPVIEDFFPDIDSLR